MIEPQECTPKLGEEQHHEVVEQHPLLTWTSLNPGDVVALRSTGSQEWAGTIESRTSDGLIIWIRDDLNDRRLFHFRECESVRVIQ